MIGRLPRFVHQIDQTINRIGAGLLDHIGIARQRPQHGNIIGRLDLQAAAGNDQPRRQMRGQEQSGAVGHRHVGPGPHRRRRQNDAIKLHGRWLRHRRQDHRPAHAFAQRIKRHAGMARPHQSGKIRKILAHRFAARPQAWIGPAPETALVIGKGGDAVLCPKLRRLVEGIGIVVHAMQGDDDGAGAAVRIPMAKGQLHAVMRNKHVALKRWGDDCGSVRRRKRGAARQQQSHCQHHPCGQFHKANLPNSRGWSTPVPWVT